MEITPEEKGRDEIVVHPEDGSTPMMQNALPQTTPFYKNKQMLIALFVAIILLMGAGYYVYTTQSVSNPVVAIVNGKKIYQKELDENILLIEQNAIQQGADITQEAVKAEIRTQAIDVLVNNALLITAAKKDGLTVEKEEIQAKYDELVTQIGSEEELKTKMTEVGLTEEKLLKNIEDRIIADKYIEANTAIKSLTVSDEEIAEFMKQISTGDAKIPPLEEIRPQIEDQILSQKQQQVVIDLIEKLKSEGQIEIKV